MWVISMKSNVCAGNHWEHQVIEPRVHIIWMSSWALASLVQVRDEVMSLWTCCSNCSKHLRASSVSFCVKLRCVFRTMLTAFVVFKRRLRVKTISNSHHPSSAREWSICGACRWSPSIRLYISRAAFVGNIWARKVAKKESPETRDWMRDGARHRSTRFGWSYSQDYLRLITQTIER